MNKPDKRKIVYCNETGSNEGFYSVIDYQRVKRVKYLDEIEPETDETGQVESLNEFVSVGVFCDRVYDSLGKAKPVDMWMKFSNYSLIYTPEGVERAWDQKIKMAEDWLETVKWQRDVKVAFAKNNMKKFSELSRSTNYYDYYPRSEEVNE